MKLLNFSNLTFDDYTFSDYGLWTQICDDCSTLEVQNFLARNEGSGICGVLNCENESDHYLDIYSYHI